MQEDLGLTPPEEELEAALRGLRPADLAGSRDQVMFRAGYANAARRSRLWRAACAGLGIMLAVSIIWRSGAFKTGTAPDPIRVAGQSQVPAMEERTRQTPGMGREAEALRLRQAVLEQGMDALPAWHPVSGSAKEARPDGRQVEDLTSAI